MLVRTELLPSKHGGGEEGGGGFVVAQLVLQLVHLRKLLVPDWLKGNAVFMDHQYKLQ